MNKKILIIEDEIEIADLLKDYIDKAGYAAFTLNTGAGAIDTLKKLSPDAVILDLMLPVMDGIEICKEIRKTSGIPIIMLTAKVEEIDRLIGLEVGADDYICKPFSFREVVARLKAVLRRSDPEKVEDNIKIGDVNILPALYKVTVGDKEVILTRSEFMLLLTMAKHPGVVFSRADLISNVHGYEFEGYDRTVDSHIKNLRKKLSEHSETDIVHTIYGVGYKVEA